MSKNKLQFHGTQEEFATLLTEAGIVGDWSGDGGANGFHFKEKGGAKFGWWPSKGTVTVQGAEPAKSTLERRLHALFEDGEVLTKQQARAATSGQIFVVHGHDKDTRDALELALRRLGLEPFILMNSSGGGKTIIEALEGHIGKDYSSSFGIVLLTPDDKGYAIADGDTKIEPRPRQNVVLETGMLLASLTRDRMALLVKGHLELPSDLNGVLYLGFNDHIREVLPKLVARLKEAGIVFDDGKLAEAMA
jgi:predicted nucleotide-binding protein